ncbi:transcription antitermination factor NusB [Candidatus Schneideria nysicola]|uniref:transcription antitermination factor NusB n=1 Tax=Candidatus Schneideria nysicola TaxID=1081631 RepID=UPI001CAA7B95|nr:transcription antitermination factor NusB [Candidatus Schneideria nysicola]UAJ65266.1 transcription antitermination factor NusB [Candidatus Schneideria nysicola]UAJ65801.1 transcription antitermination factor NusB [Candidatus Schneideria nysicola]
MTRHRARECAIQALYAWHLSKNNIAEIEIDFLSNLEVMAHANISYFREVYLGTATHAEKLDKLMLPYLSRRIEQIGYIELAVLRLALYEFLQCKDVPYRVTINEAIELAKKFGPKESYKFINGVLDKIAVHIRHSPQYSQE